MMSAPTTGVFGPYDKPTRDTRDQLTTEHTQDDHGQGSRIGPAGPVVSNLLPALGDSTVVPLTWSSWMGKTASRLHHFARFASHRRGSTERRAKERKRESEEVQILTSQNTPGRVQAC